MTSAQSKLAFAKLDLKIEAHIFILDSTPSTPAAEYSEADFTTPASPTSTATSTYTSLLEHLTDRYRASLCDNLPNSEQLAREGAIIDYLHSNAATPSDVELLIPQFNRVHAITNKLSTNIGLFHSRNQISSSDLEAMLVHLLTQGDGKAVLFERTKAKIERFKNEASQRKVRESRGRCRRRANQHEQNEREKAEHLARVRGKNTTQKGEKRWSEADFPSLEIPPCRKPDNRDSLSTVPSEVQLLQFGESEKAHRALGKRIDLNELFQSVSHHPSCFCNFPKKLTVCLPSPSMILIPPSASSHPPQPKRRKPTKEESLWSRTKTSPDYIFQRTKTEKIAVRLPKPEAVVCMSAPFSINKSRRMFLSACPAVQMPPFPRKIRSSSAAFGGTASGSLDLLS